MEWFPFLFIRISFHNCSFSFSFLASFYPSDPFLSASLSLSFSFSFCACAASKLQDACLCNCLSATTKKKSLIRSYGDLPFPSRIIVTPPEASPSLSLCLSPNNLPNVSLSRYSRASHFSTFAEFIKGGLPIASFVVIPRSSVCVCICICISKESPLGVELRSSEVLNSSPFLASILRSSSSV